jgi:hypothetical protein
VGIAEQRMVEFLDSVTLQKLVDDHLAKGVQIEDKPAVKRAISRDAGGQTGARQCAEFGVCTGQRLCEVLKALAVVSYRPRFFLSLKPRVQPEMSQPTPAFSDLHDYGATTPCDPRVVDAMIPWLREHFGNPASRSHAWGWEAEAAVEKAREQVAELIGADPREIVWTSGATESNNLALKGAAHFYQSKGKHLITVKTEHKAVLDTMRELERQGFEVTYLDVQEDGLLL